MKCMSQPSVRRRYSSRYGPKAIPPWKNTSRFGHTSLRLPAPLMLRMCLMTVRNQLGTPDMLVTLLFKAACARAGSFISQSGISAIRFSGTRTKSASGVIRFISVALRSPTCTPLGRSGISLAKLPPRIIPFPANILVAGLAAM